MRVNVLGDFDWESRLDRFLDSLTKTGYRSFFEDRGYGNDLTANVVVLVCQKPELGLKPRIRLPEPERTLYMDVVLNLARLKSADDRLRRYIVRDRLLSELSGVLGKYKRIDFDRVAFLKDLAGAISDL